MTSGRLGAAITWVSYSFSYIVLAPQLTAQQGPSFDPVRLMRDVQTYYEFGVHRTAHPGDLETSAWLEERLRAAGLTPSEHVFGIRQFFLDEASIEISEDDVVEAFPIWLPHPTSASGVTAPLVVVDEATPPGDMLGAIALVRAGAGFGSRGRLEERAVAAGAVGILVETSDGAGSGLLQTINAEREYVDHERPVPHVVFGSADGPRLLQAVGHPVTLRVEGTMVDRAEAINVYASYVVDEAADWIVVSTPSSGWFTCAGERGPGIAMWLALAEWVSTRRDGLNYFFVATSGHELDYLGARLFHQAHLAPPPSRTRAWLHLGANIATPPWEDVDGTLRPQKSVGSGTLQATEDLVAPLIDAFSRMPGYTLRTNARIGEFRDLLDHGYTGLGIVGGSNPWFHVPVDDPRAVDSGILADVTAATARALLSVETLAPAGPR